MVKRNTFSALMGLREMAISPGSVFLGSWENVDHEKYSLLLQELMTIRSRYVPL